MGPNWLTCILDGLGEREIAENFRLCSHVATNMASQCPPAGALQNPGQRTPDVLKCPSAIEIIDDDRFTGMGYQNLAKGNYAACYGAEFYMNNPRSQPNGTNVKRNGRQKDGMFGVVNVLGRRSGAANVEWGETIALPEGGGDEFKGSFKYGAALDMGVRPGTSDCDNVAKTILLSEVVGYESPEDGRGAWVWGAVGATAFTAYTTPNADGRMGNINYDRIPACEDSIPEDDPLHCQRRTGPSAYAAARSMHPGLVVVLFADYHSTPITDAIDAEVWKSMASKSGPKEEGRYLEASGY
jgi:hypothetical protein